MGDLGPKSLCTKKWPDQIFPTVNFVFSHEVHFGPGGGTPLLLQCMAILILACTHTFKLSHTILQGQHILSGAITSALTLTLATRAPLGLDWAQGLVGFQQVHLVFQP